MFFEPPIRGNPKRSIGASFALHALALLAVTVYAYQRPERIFTRAGTSLGKHIELVYLPAREPSPALHHKAAAKPAPRAILRTSAIKPVIEPQVPAPRAPALIAPPLTSSPPIAPTDPASLPASSPETTPGSDSLGSGAGEIAFTTYSPSPAPDLSVLPHGAQGDVVVDVTIDTAGKVASLEVLRTLGFGIESSVLETVRTWIFRPATKDGVPVASAQELHFHFGPA